MILETCPPILEGLFAKLARRVRQCELGCRGHVRWMLIHTAALSFTGSKEDVLLSEGKGGRFDAKGGGGTEGLADGG